jgi:hypothetical protein
VALILLLYDAYKPRPVDLSDPSTYRPSLPEVEDLTEKVEFNDPRIKKSLGGTQNTLGGKREE